MKQLVSFLNISLYEECLYVLVEALAVLFRQETFLIGDSLNEV